MFSGNIHVLKSWDSTTEAIQFTKNVEIGLEISSAHLTSPTMHILASIYVMMFKTL